MAFFFTSYKGAFLITRLKYRAVILLFILIQGYSQAQLNDFYWGVDLSYVNEMESCGAVYQAEGKVQDLFTLFSTHGANLVRARLWHTPADAYSTLEDVRRTFARAQSNGMVTMLDFHYSDTWADPAHQHMPQAWKPIQSDDLLADAVYEYTYDTLASLYADKLTPHFVQIGNETNLGMLTDSQTIDWQRQKKLFNAGIRAVRDFSLFSDIAPKVVLHIAQPENLMWWFTEAVKAGITDFDVIGMSYYPEWSAYSIQEVGQTITIMRQVFHKTVMIVEVGYPWTTRAFPETANNLLSRAINGYAISPQGQLAFLQDLTQTVIDSGGIGVIYWEPAWVSTACQTAWGQGSHWENATFFSFNSPHVALPAISFLDPSRYTFSNAP